MPIRSSTNASGNLSYRRRMSLLIRLPSPPRSLNKAHLQKFLCLTGAPTSQTCSQNKPMPNYHLTAIMTTPSTFNQHSPPVLPKSIHLTQPSFRPVKSLLMNTWRQDRSYPPNLPKLSHSFSYPKKTDPYTPAKTTDISIPTLFEMHTLCCSSQNSLTTWRMPPSSRNSTCSGAITTSVFVKKTNGKLPLLLPLDSSNQQWCSSGFATHHLHFKPLWTTSSPTWWQKNGWKFIWMTSVSTPKMTLPSTMNGLAVFFCDYENMDFPSKSPNISSMPHKWSS